jgi:hypothetical protein
MSSSRWSRKSINFSFLHKRPTEYHYIQDFENTSEKECKRCDKDNDIIYERNIALYTKTKKFLDKHNAIFKMEGPPDAPRVPSNYDLYVIHQNRNSLTNNKIQTIAILYLLQLGYKLVIDPEVELIQKVMNKENKLFEPYMAIDIASSLNKKFVEEVAKFYEMKGERIGSPELLTFEEKIDRFNEKGMIQYLDIGEISPTEKEVRTFMKNPNGFPFMNPMQPTDHPLLEGRVMRQPAFAPQEQATTTASASASVPAPASAMPTGTNSAPARATAPHPVVFPQAQAISQEHFVTKEQIKDLPSVESFPPPAYGVEHQEEGKINIIINK